MGPVCSEYLNNPCGVPQGSVLGHLLFLLYINDLSQSTDILDIHLFADDSNLFYAKRNLKHLENTINNELKQVSRWLSANKLSLNIGKPNFIIFHPHQKKKQFSPQLLISNKCLKEETSIQYLGVMFDCNLKRKAHINYLTKKVERNIDLISKIIYFVDLCTLINLYYSHIYPFLTYSLITWGHTYKSIIKPPFLLQKQTVRIITFSSYTEYTNPLFKSLNLVKLYDLVKISTAIFMFKFHNHILPTNFNSFFTPVNQVHNYNTRLSSNYSYSLSKPRTNYGLFNIRYQGPVIWNSLDISLKSSSLSTFKSKIKELYVDQY